jgi:hypothetical protein
MSAARKYRNIYSKQSDDKKSSEQKDKQEIEAYIGKIGDLLEKDPEAQKKAALIISRMINSK